MLPYDYCVNQLDLDDLVDSALEPSLKPGLQAAAAAYLEQHDENTAATDPGLLRAASSYLASLDIDQLPSHTGLELPDDDSYAFTAALVHMTSLAGKQDGDRCLAYQEAERADPTWYTDVRAHIDGGSMVTTTNDPTLVWYARPAVKPPLLRVADKRPHRSTHEGYICVSADTGTTLVPTFLTPSLPATILSPDAACRDNGCSGYTAISNCDGHNCSVTMRHCKRRSGDLRIPAVLRRGMLYTKPLIRPTEAQRSGPRPPPSLPGCVDQPRTIHQTTTESPCCPATAPVCQTTTDCPCCPTAVSVHSVSVCQTTTDCPCCPSHANVCQTTSDSPIPDSETPPPPPPPPLFLFDLPFARQGGRISELTEYSFTDSRPTQTTLASTTWTSECAPRIHTTSLRAWISQASRS